MIDDAIEIIQYRDADGWTCLMYQAYMPKKPSMPCVRVTVSDDLRLWGINSTIAQQKKIDEQECKKMIAIAKELKARNVFTK